MRKLQQGDVIIRRSKGIPVGAKRVPKSSRGFVLAEGEATGHAHVIGDDIRMYEKGGVLYIKADRPVTLNHEEHKPITLSRGFYAIDLVRESNPFEEALARRVRD
jgi:hypothetical protein